MLEYHVGADEIEASVAERELIQRRSAHRTRITPFCQRKQISVAPKEDDSAREDAVELFASPFGQRLAAAARVEPASVCAESQTIDEDIDRAPDTTIRRVDEPPIALPRRQSGTITPKLSRKGVDVFERKKAQSSDQGSMLAANEPTPGNKARRPGSKKGIRVGIARRRLDLAATMCIPWLTNNEYVVVTKVGAEIKPSVPAHPLQNVSSDRSSPLNSASHGDRSHRMLEDACRNAPRLSRKSVQLSGKR